VVRAIDHHTVDRLAQVVALRILRGDRSMFVTIRINGNKP
jgi:hypothetical protein